MEDAGSHSSDGEPASSGYARPTASHAYMNHGVVSSDGCRLKGSDWRRNAAVR